MQHEGKKIILLLGGARSGKSARAQQMAEEMGGRVLFCATAQPLDEEMLRRIEAHRKSRPSGWNTIEAPVDVGNKLVQSISGYDTIIIDCITLLISNCLCTGVSDREAAAAVSKEIESITRLMRQRDFNFILVSNEVGSGLVPDNKLGRTYRDLLGQANQQLAACADEVYFMAAGLSLKMK